MNSEKDRKQEVYYQSQILEEFKIIKKEIEYQLLYSKFQEANVLLLLKSIANPTPPNEYENWFFAIEHVGWLNPASYSENTWNELKSTGNLDLITNKKITQTISAFYSYLDKIYKINDEWDKFNLNYKDKAHDIIDPELRLRISSNLLPWFIRNHLDSIPNAEPYILKFKHINGIRGDLGDILISRKAGNDLITTDLLDMADTVINLLTTELNQAAK